MGYLICGKCKSYYKLQSGESAKDFVDKCDCGGNLRYVVNLDIVDPYWKEVSLRKKPAKKEIIKNKIFSFPRNIKNRLYQFYHDNIGRRIYNARSQSRIHRRPQGIQAGFINSILNELNLHNIQWILVAPATIALTLLLTFTNGISTLLAFIVLVMVGYLSQNMIIGAKNASIIGGISFFLGSLFQGSFLYIILYLILGIINGIVCGLIGGYINKRLHYE
jgi:glucose-6-phosphate-specific signal transduction histidine kinase